MCSQGVHCCYCLDLIFRERGGVYGSEKFNVCTNYQLLSLLGSRMLETWWHLFIRGTACVHTVSVVAIACIILSRNKNIAVLFHSKIMFLSVCETN
jgi:hypothetical protein